MVEDIGTCAVWDVKDSDKLDNEFKRIRAGEISAADFFEDKLKGNDKDFAPLQTSSRTITYPIGKIFSSSNGGGGD